MKKIFLISLFLLVFSSTVYSQEKMRIAVLGFKPDGVSETLAKMASDRVRDKFINSGKFIVIEREQMDTILKEQGLQKSGCTNSACAVEIGKLISARKILIGEVSFVADKYYINVRIVDVEKGVSEFSARDKASTEDLVEQAVDRLNAKIMARIEGKNVDDADFVEVRQVTMSSSERRSNGFKAMAFSIVPGLGQLVYGGGLSGYPFSIAEGVFFMGGCAALGYFTFSTYASFKDKQDEYRDLPSNLDQSVYDKKYDQVKSAERTYNIIKITLISLYALNIVDAYFSGSRPDRKTVIGRYFDARTTGGLMTCLYQENYPEKNNVYKACYIYKF